MLKNQRTQLTIDDPVETMDFTKMTTLTELERNIARLPAIAGYLALLLVSGCGLAMDNEDRLARGEQAYDEGDFSSAVIDAKDVLIEEPDNLRARLLLGRASVEAGDGATAEKELQRAIGLGAAKVDVAANLARALILQRKFDEVLSTIPVDGLPSSETEASVRISHGDALMGLNQAEAAREMYTSALVAQPENLSARLGVVSSFVAEDNFVQARGALDQVLETYGDEPSVWLYSGSLNLRVGDFEAAEANFEFALELADSSGDEIAKSQALAGVAESLFEQQDVESARLRVDELAESSPQSLQTNLLMARIAYYDEDWALAQQKLQQVLQVAPNYRPAQVLLGTVHLRSGNLSQAEMYLSAAVASVPSDVRARQLLAETRLQAQKAEEALEVLNPILRQSDPDSMSLQMAARASLGSQNVSDALEYLRRSLEEDPDNTDLRFQLAATLLQEGRHDEAQAVLDAADVSGSEDDAFRRDGLGVLTAIAEGKLDIALDAAKRVADTYNDRYSAFVLLGAVQVANKDSDNARKSFVRAVQLEPSNLIARQYIAAIDESVGEFDSAKSIYEDVLLESPDAVWATAGLGRIALFQEDLELAAAHFRSAMESVSEDSEYRLILAKVEMQLGNKDAATDLLEENLDATFGHFPSGVMLGALRVESGDLDEALDISKELQKRFPDNPAAYAFEGEIHIFAGNLAYADRAYEKALSLGRLRYHAVRASLVKRDLGLADAQRPLIDYLKDRPLDSEVRLVLADYYMQSGGVSKAIAAYEQVLAYEPENVLALNNLAWHYYLAGDTRALETARKAYAAMPDNGAIADTLGWILVQDGSVAEGEEILRQAVQLSSGSAEIRYHHAAALAKLGRVDEARETLDEILADEQEFASRKDAENLLAEL